MSPSDPMGPLERRYRRLLRLLPAGHRAARGEELLGLLLDLDDGRDRPSLRQAVGVFGLALRLRLAGAASLLLAAFLVAYSTEILEIVYSINTGGSISVDSRFPMHNTALVLLIPSLLRIGLTVSWIVGARRTALAVLAVLLAYSLSAGGPWLLDVALLVPLGAAVAWRWPAPRPRVVLLATIPLAMLLWTLMAVWNVYMLPDSKLLSVSAVVALLGMVGGLLRHRPSRNGSDPHGPRDRPTPATG
ncbi:hypothetical protein [Dactylosporangium sp. CA-233914]|uniref:hypothetical protein n=1 Tax=Dactylosporangium sp. CA-233914 TaxID=3239934 RepID=UPI003D8AC0C4